MSTLRTIFRDLARRTGLGCWCCGYYGREHLLFRQHFPFNRGKYDLTWCTECKFAACPKCGDG